MRMPPGIRLVCAFGLLAFLCLFGSVAYGLEVHSLVDDRCQVVSGILVRVDEDRLRLVDLDGASRVWPIDRVAAVVIHRTLENPIQSIEVDEDLRQLARDVWVGRDRTPTFSGWPVGFHDQLVIFFDVDGRSHVLEPQDIRAVRPAAAIGHRLAPSVFAKVALDYPPELIPCNLPRQSEGLRPSRVLGDRIKVGDYLARLRDRYQALDSFEERTRVYPRPFVFDPITRLGLTYLSGSRGEVLKYLPLYFQWSSGRPYRFQSQIAVGAVTSPWVPVLEPTVAFRSDVKSHFFTASFVGNLPSLPAGEYAFRDREVALFPVAEMPAVDELFNYLVLMGADWGPFSLSGGALYRAVRANFSRSVRREVTAEQMSPTVRFMVVGSRYRVRALYFRTRQNRSGGEGMSSLTYAFPIPTGPMSGSSPPVSPANPGYDLRIDSFRAGVDLDLGMDLSLSADEILTFGKYSEQGLGAIEFTHAYTSAVLTGQFNRYVATKFIMNIYHRRYDVSVEDTRSLGPDPRIRTKFQFGGVLEFLF